MRITVALAVLLLPGLLLAPAWRLAGLGAGEDDVLYYYPARVFFHEAVASGQSPWLSPWTGLGRPFVADPQTAIWYPTTWLFAVMAPLHAYPVDLYLHYGMALWGMYHLLRSLRLQRPAALFGGIAFAFCGFLLAHRAHFTMQHAAAWTPLVFWRFHRCAEARQPKDTSGGAVRLFAAAGVLALQALAGHVQVAALTAFGALLFLLGAPSAGRTAAAKRGPPGPAAVVLRWTLASVCAAGLFAIQWVPTFNYMRLCTRIERTYRDFVENSWSPASLVNWVAPMLLGQRTPNFFADPYWGPSHQVEQFGYAGLLPLLLAALALRPGRWHDPRRRPWLLVGGFGLLFALGEYGPLCPLLYWLPGSSLFRCPARALLLVNLAVAALAATVLNDLAGAVSPDRARLRAALQRVTQHPLLLAALVAVVPAALLLLSLPLLNDAARAAAWRALRPWNPAIWVPVGMALLSVFALGIGVRHWRRPGLLWLIPAVTALDLGIIGWTIDVPAKVSDPVQFVTPRAGAAWMAEVRRSGQRLWVVNARRADGTPGEYVQPVDKAVANTNVLRGIQALTDYGPLQPRAYVQRFGFQPWGESWKPDELLADTSWTRLYNVGWILLTDAAFPAPAGCDLFATTPEGWRLYRSPDAAGPAMLEDAAQSAAIRWDHPLATEFEVRVDTWPGPGTTAGRSTPNPSTAAPRLVFSRLALPGWSVRVNGNPATPTKADGLLLAVDVPAGELARVSWSYAPPGIRLGAAVSGVTLLLLTAGCVASSRRTEARRPRRVRVIRSK
ncbi:MAG: hypothetical protein AB1716_00130 [Planctomycetota bacterium]